MSDQDSHRLAGGKLRCAIYTRKSSEEGLQQEFNSLDAQREACEAFVASQKREGWLTIPELYDDGGFSGATIQRPAFQRLLSDVAAGQVDVVVVYKVDRLTRSLSDFAKIVETFDKHSVSFVSVTQQFNTTSSMGRLTLNILLSFAQFEREVTGERIRDKIAASKRRGMWMGGHPPLGYDAKDRKLVINDTEAETVRHIFRHYLDLGSVKKLCEELQNSGIRSKHRKREDGTIYGGMPLARGAISYLLQNQIYLGKILHKGELFDGQHDPIVPTELFQAVQHHLMTQGPGETAKRKLASPAILKGLVFDGAGNRLQPTHSKKDGRKYRYYVSASIIRDAKSGKDGLRVPAADLEKLIIRIMFNRLKDRHWLAEFAEAHKNAGEFEEVASRAVALANELEQLHINNTGLLNKIIDRIEVHKKTVLIKLILIELQQLLHISVVDKDTSQDGVTKVIEVPGHLLRCGKEVRLVIGNDQVPAHRVDQRLIWEITQAQKWFADLARAKQQGLLISPGSPRLMLPM